MLKEFCTATYQKLSKHRHSGNLLYLPEWRCLLKNVKKYMHIYLVHNIIGYFSSISQPLWGYYALRYRQLLDIDGR
ncbi:hypothetical protein AADEFJLK_03625 [Methylovulum psychrotolerans]|uniref:Uncharacterized protein n=1 Tax=Methylovulum psychrotolerans TaxID=1704499 RepID=A0A2S5CIT8_9GAMM|nr:hypothetical protein AADEFJLK_03625 [Methylovulum psychrotolerans]